MSANNRSTIFQKKFINFKDFKDEIANRGEVVGSVLHTALREGVTVYEQPDLQDNVESRRRSQGKDWLLF